MDATTMFFRDLKVLVGVHSTSREALSAICDIYKLKKYDENCCDPELGAMVNSVTSLINKHHPVGGLSLDVDDVEFYITQHPDAGDFELKMTIGEFSRY